MNILSLIFCCCTCSIISKCRYLVVATPADQGYYSSGTLSKPVTASTIINIYQIIDYHSLYTGLGDSVHQLWSTHESLMMLLPLTLNCTLCTAMDQILIGKLARYCYGALRGVSQCHVALIVYHMVGKLWFENSDGLIFIYRDI